MCAMYNLTLHCKGVDRSFVIRCPYRLDFVPGLPQVADCCSQAVSGHLQGDAEFLRCCPLPD